MAPVVLGVGRVGACAVPKLLGLERLELNVEWKGERGSWKVGERADLGRGGGVI